ncbi:membrane protein [Vallitalea longa]|uniref:Membrane protein n=1 Tax=Vallitalea longa TaxID=2936439 RepID=A0A9W6DH75_9FIRM|nr:DHHW family protein [Vallitalea longa]GKX31277.1 membrane protein [Vallitalea longa]
MKLIHNAILAILFIIIIFAVFLSNMIKPDRKFSENENRYLSTKPKFSFERLLEGKYSKDIEKYIDDQFIFRENFITAKSNIEQLFPRKDINGVYLGKDDYLIEKCLEKDFNYAQLDKNIELVNSFASTNDSLDVSMIIVPTSSLVMNDKLPDNAPMFNQQKVFDNLNKRFNSLRYIDVSQTLIEHNNEYIFYKSDHHWTTFGAYYAYMAYCKNLGMKHNSYESYNIENVTKSFKGTYYSKVLLDNIYDQIDIYKTKDQSPYKVYYNNSKTVTDSVFDYDKLEEKDQYQIFFGGNHPELKIVQEENTAEEKNLLVIKDSYANSFVPLIMNNYNKVCMIDLRYFNGNLNEYIKDNNITDVLFLYGIMSFSNDNVFNKLI